MTIDKKAEELARSIYFDDDGSGRTSEARIAALIDAELREERERATDKAYEYIMRIIAYVDKDELRAAILSEEN